MLILFIEYHFIEYFGKCMQFALGMLTGPIIVGTLLRTVRVFRRKINTKILMCNCSSEVMAGGVVKCHRGHVVCNECVVRCAGDDLGILGDVDWRRSVLQTLTASGFTCSVCGIHGPFRQSLDTQHAVNALPVRCGFTSLGLSCRWTGTRNQFAIHQHVFDDLDRSANSQEQSPRRAVKRPNSDSDGDSDEHDKQHVKQFRHERTLNDDQLEKDDDVEFQEVQTVDPDVVHASAIPHVNAAEGKSSVESLVHDTADPSVSRAGTVHDSAQREDVNFEPIQKDQNADGGPMQEAATEDDNRDSTFVTDTAGHRESQSDIGDFETIELRQNLGGAAHSIVVHRAEIVHDVNGNRPPPSAVTHIGGELRERQAFQVTEGFREAADVDINRIDEIRDDVDGQTVQAAVSESIRRNAAGERAATTQVAAGREHSARGQEMDAVEASHGAAEGGELGAVHDAMCEQGIIPKPQVGLIERAATAIYKTARGVIDKFKTSTP